MTHNDPSKLFLNSTVRLMPGMTAAVRQKLLDAFGSDDPYAATKADWDFEDLVASLLLNWLQKDAPVPDEIIQKWQRRPPYLSQVWLLYVPMTLSEAPSKRRH